MRGRTESPYYRVAEGLRDAALVLEQVMRHVGKIGITVTEDVGEGRRGVVHFYPRTPQERNAIAEAVTQAFWMQGWKEPGWVTEPLIAPSETQHFGRYLELSIEPKWGK